MFGSDVLDAAAIGAGAALLGGIVAGLFSFLTTLMNRRSKRYELAFDKSLEACRTMIEIMSDTNKNIKSFRELMELTNIKFITSEQTNKQPRKDEDDEDDEDRDTTFSTYVEFIDSKMSVEFEYKRNKLYLPKHIDTGIQKYINTALYDNDAYNTYIYEFFHNKTRNNPLITQQQDVEKYFNTVPMFLVNECYDKVLDDIRKHFGYE